ncbi:unnamed protein product [Brassicogethes aeneus]|uniref:Uncharacterized protein n=1 Tax=Brassicogethes aeneus TaxID=1431903 RepID=A0A9P0BHQ8_BRAAE|nr:unnamed protein product [Brassicogethes aeneus]
MPTLSHIKTPGATVETDSSQHSRNQTWYPGPRLRRNLFSATQKNPNPKNKTKKKKEKKEKEKDRSRRKTLNDIPSTTNKVVENEVARINSKINQNNAAHSTGFDIKKCLLERENEKLAKDNERLTKLVETLSAQISAQSAQIENLQLQMEKLVSSLTKPAPQSVEMQDNTLNIDADSPKRKKAKKTNDSDKSMETDIENSQPLEYQGPTKQIATTSSYTPPIISNDLTPHSPGAAKTAPNIQENMLVGDSQLTPTQNENFPMLPPPRYSPPAQTTPGSSGSNVQENDFPTTTPSTYHPPTQQTPSNLASTSQAHT